jgi:hypothetical protein
VVLEIVALEFVVLEMALPPSCAVAPSPNIKAPAQSIAANFMVGLTLAPHSLIITPRRL